MKKLIITVLILAVSITGIVYVLNKNKEENLNVIKEVSTENTLVAVQTSIASYQELSDQYITNGRFMPKREIKLSADVPGKVTRIYVKEGSLVRKGQVLAIIDSGKQNVNLANANAVYNTAKNEVQRFESAFSTGGVTKRQLEQVKLQFESAKNNLKSAKLLVADVSVKAPFSGIVNMKNIEVGTFVSPGMSLFEIVDVSLLKLTVLIDEKNISQIKIGQKVKVLANTIPDAEFTGVVSFIAPKANAGYSFRVDLEIQNTNQKLKAGMFGTVNIDTSIGKSRLIVPKNAFVGGTQSGQIFIVKEGTAVLTKVIVGEIFENDVEVLSGITAGAEVITSGQVNVSNGAKIKTIN